MDASHSFHFNQAKGLQQTPEPKTRHGALRSSKNARGCGLPSMARHHLRIVGQGNVLNICCTFGMLSLEDLVSRTMIISENMQDGDRDQNQNGLNTSISFDTF